MLPQLGVGGLTPTPRKENADSRTIAVPRPAETATIRYTINGRARVLSAKVDHDWADPEAVAAFARDLETTIGDGRHFWAADNGQASVLFFLTDAEADKVNSLRTDVLVRLRYVAD